jgi:hypothetical protein
VKFANKSIDVERKWQNEHLPSEIRDLVLIARTGKENSFNDLKIK